MIDPSTLTDRDSELTIASCNSPRNNILNVEHKGPALNRIIMITVNMSSIITKNDEAYKTLVESLVKFQNSDVLKPDDYVCYNVGSSTL